MCTVVRWCYSEKILQVVLENFQSADIVAPLSCNPQGTERVTAHATSVMDFYKFINLLLR